MPGIPFVVTPTPLPVIAGGFSAGKYVEQAKEAQLATPWYQSVSQALGAVGDVISRGIDIVGGVKSQLDIGQSGSISAALGKIGESIKGAFQNVASGAREAIQTVLPSNIPVKASVDPTTIALIVGGLLLVVFVAKR